MDSTGVFFLFFLVPHPLFGCCLLFSYDVSLDSFVVLVLRAKYTKLVVCGEGKKKTGDFN